MRHLKRGGRYLRLADPRWSDPLSGEYARDAGGRWNAPGTFPVVYLNRTLDVARAQLRHKLEPRGIHPEDLDPDRGPLLIHADAPTRPYVDSVTARGVASLDLPPSYPLDKRGNAVPHEVCQPLGQAAWDAGEPGVACRSLASAPNEGEELAYFSRDRKLSLKGEETFAEWYWQKR